MEVIFDGVAARLLTLIGTDVVGIIVWKGYKRNSFSPWAAWLFILTFTGYVVALLRYRYTSGHIGEEASEEASYALVASIHGTLSLVAMLLALYVFFMAERAKKRGENYFQTHKRLSLILVIVWPLSLLTGLFL